MHSLFLEIPCSCAFFISLLKCTLCQVQLYVLNVTPIPLNISESIPPLIESLAVNSLESFHCKQKSVGTTIYIICFYFPFYDTWFILIRISLQLEGFVVRSIYFRKKYVYCFFSLLCFNVFLAFLKIQGSTVASGIVSLLLNCLKHATHLFL